MPTWGKVTTGFVVSVLAYGTWGAFVAYSVAEANARRRADPDPGPDSAGAYTGLFYMLLTPCVLVPLLVVGVILCFSRSRRPYGIGMASGFVVPLLSRRSTGFSCKQIVVPGCCPGRS